MPIEIPCYGLWERAYHPEPSSQNPFDREIEALWTHELGSRLQVTGFYDGAGAYRVRFMPAATGRWEFRVNLGGRMIETGTITCVSSEIPGPLRQDPKHPYHLVFADGSHFYPLGTTAYNSIAACGHDRTAYRRFLDYYQARRFNWLRFFLMNTRWPTAGGSVWPWGGTPEKPDLTTYNLAAFQRAEAVIQELAERKMIASVILLRACEEALAQAGADRMRVTKGLIRYAVARLGAYWNVVWNLANEWQRDAVFDHAEMDELGAYLHILDPYERLTSCHHYGRFEFYDKEWTDMSSLQHRGLPHEVNQWILQNRHFDKPVLNEEYGYEGDNHAPPNDADNVRHDHWAITMAGGYGTYGDKTKGPKIAAYMSGLLEDAVGTQAPETLQHLPSFMETTGYRQMEPANEFLTGCDPRQAFCLARPGHEYIVYLVRGQPFTLNLTHVDGTLSARWYDPRTGQSVAAPAVTIYQSMDQAPSGSSEWNSSRGLLAWHKIEFEPPDTEQDWVLYLIRD